MQRETGFIRCWHNWYNVCECGLGYSDMLNSHIPGQLLVIFVGPGGSQHGYNAL